MALHLNELESPSSKNALNQVWFKLAQRSGEEVKIFLKNTDGRTDRGTPDVK